ncbi:hypothetical protein OBBRIDRAFT_288889 [Obba rivulosa]|uniref:Uncharacterized protein n=1 Tax=Obba rivulosa TaxID=1052685 RepID=A0A8E2AJJ1_9APHY|nr:hypothetical protein OBBRIDRAFT_288889 [Obba rivulosa]
MYSGFHIDRRLLRKVCTDGVFSGTSVTEAHWLKAHWSMSRVAATFGAVSSAGFPKGPPNSSCVYLLRSTRLSI